MVATIISSIVAVAKALPAIASMVEMLLDQWIEYKISIIEKDQVSVNTQRTILLNRLAKAETNEERITIAHALKRLSL